MKERGKGDLGFLLFSSALSRKILRFELSVPHPTPPSLSALPLATAVIGGSRPRAAIETTPSMEMDNAFDVAIPFANDLNPDAQYLIGVFLACS